MACAAARSVPEFPHDRITVLMTSTTEYSYPTDARGSRVSTSIAVLARSAPGSCALRLSTGLLIDGLGEIARWLSSAFEEAATITDRAPSQSDWGGLPRAGVVHQGIRDRLITRSLGASSVKRKSDRREPPQKLCVRPGRRIPWTGRRDRSVAKGRRPARQRLRRAS